MLWFIGIGLSGAESIPVESTKIISKADIVYMEQFTSPMNETEIENIRKLVQGKFKMAKRWMVEDGNEILKSAKNSDVTLLSYGDPYVATTHTELRTRAIREKIEVHSIHAASSLTSVIGECGLHFYKIGKIATIMNDMNSLTTPYYTVYKNIIEGNHSVLLLEYNQEKGFSLDPRFALSYLIDAEKGQRRKVVNLDTFAIVASRIGFKEQKIVCGKISSILEKDFGDPPHTVIIPGRLHFTETDALKMHTCIDTPQDNTIKKISVQMIEKYVPMVQKSLEEVKPYCKDDMIENVESYIRDAEKFLDDGQDEVAILSIGYADGLVDALRIANKLELVCDKGNDS